MIKIERNKICLNGYWDFCPASSRLEQIPSNWEDVKILVPSPWNINSFVAAGQRDYENETLFLRGGEFDLFPEYPKSWENAKSGWYKTEFFIPEDWIDCNITLRFEAVLYHSEYYINGQLVHSDSDGFLPVEFSIDQYATPGKSNTLIVGATMLDQFQITLPDGSTKYEIPTGSFWGEKMGGIWQDVFLNRYPKTYITDVFVRTDIQNSVLKIVTEISDAKQYQLELHLRQHNSNRTFCIGQNQTVVNRTSEIEFDYSGISDQIELWWPDSPSLYYLDVVLKENDDKIDEKSIRFGFRSFEVKGKKFHLNGIPYNLRNDSWHYMGFPYQNQQYARLWYKMAKDANANHIRLHAQVYPEYYLDIADEMGMLITDETAIWGSHCKYHYSMNFIANGQKHIERLIKRDRNHPSIVMWNIENECVMAYMVSADSAVDNQEQLNQRLYLLAEHAAKFDDTRPICADGCGDYDRRLEVANIHYPGKECSFESEKPVVIGEMGSMYYSTPEQVCTYDGEKVFLSFNNRLKAIGKDVFELLKHQRKWAAQTCVFNLVWYGLEPLPFKEKLCEYDDYSAPGVKPRKIGRYISTLNAGYDSELPEYVPNPVFEQTKAAYMPERFFFENLRTGYYDGERGNCTVSVFNDSLHQNQYIITCSVIDRDEVISAGNKSVVVEPSCWQETVLEYPVPHTDSTKSFKIRVTMTSNDKTVFEQHADIKVYNREYWINCLTQCCEIAVVGDCGQDVRDFLQNSRIKMDGQSDESDVLIIAGDYNRHQTKAKNIINLVPAEVDYADWVTRSGVDKAFINDGYDILTRNLTEQDLCGWDGGISEHSFVYGLNAVSMAATGTGASVMCDTVSDGKRYIISCLNLLKHICHQPAALVLLANLVKYATETPKTVLHQRSLLKTAVISKDNSALIKFLKSLNASVSLIDCDDIKSIRALNEDIIIVDGQYPTDYLNELTAKSVKKILLWNLCPDNIPLCLRGYFDILNYPLNQLIKEDTAHPTVRGIHAADLYGLERGNEAIITSAPLFIRATDKVKGILKNPDLNWRAWNHQSEYIKTASILRSEQQHKQQCYGLAEMVNNGVNISLCQINFSAQSVKLRKLAISLLTNFGVKVEKTLEDDFGRMINGNLYENKMLTALMLTNAETVNPEGIQPGINRQTNGRVWNIARLDKNNKTGVCLYGFYVYSEQDRTDLLLNPDLVGMKVLSDNDKQIYLNDEIIGSGKQFVINAVCFKSGWNKLIIKENRVVQGPVQIFFERKDNPLLDLKFSLEAPGQCEIINDSWKLGASHNDGQCYEAVKGKGSYWIAHADQHKGMFFQIDLGGEHVVSRVQFTTKALLHNNMCIAQPRSISIQSSLDGDNWNEVYEPKDEKYLSFDDGKVIISLDGIKTRHVRLMLNNVALRSWIISQLKIFENIERELTDNA